MSKSHVDPDGVVYIHAWHAEDGHWSASFDWHPQVSYGGNRAVAAAKRLVRAVEGLDESTLRVAYRSEDGRTAGLMVLAASRGGVCEECGGTGRYVGLAVVEDCRACSGTGAAEPF